MEPKAAQEGTPEMISVTVKQGAIGIESITRHVQHPDCLVLEVDCRAKYPEIGPFSPSEGIVWLNRGERTLHAENSNEPTEIRIDGLGEGRWIIEATAGRYTVFIVAFKLQGENDGLILWPIPEGR